MPGEGSGLAWDATLYDRVAHPQREWGLRLLQQRHWRGDEHVLDAGCGPGRLAVEILARIPRGRLLCVDVDERMVERAREALRDEPRATVVQSDLHRLDAVGPFDVIYSNAVLHWVPDHAALFRRFHALLRSEGELLVQCGGRGNIDVFLALAGAVARRPPYAASFRGWRPPWHFEDARATRLRLEAAGFADIECSLTQAPTSFPDRDSFLAFAAAAPLVPYMTRLGQTGLAARFLKDVVDAHQASGRPWSLDYVRLNVRARRP